MNERIRLNMASLKKQFVTDTQDDAANRAYQAFDRLQLAWYTVNARRPAGDASHFDEAAVKELNAAEEEWLAARFSQMLMHERKG